MSAPKRIFDLALALVATILLWIPILLVAALVRITSPGPAIYWSDRVGKNNRIFRMPKFRSMRIGTPAVATHLLQRPESYLTPIGSFLRKSSLDELPQLWSILRGDMSFVGPRPALFNQHDLVAQRTALGVEALVPGLTGWAQIKYPYGASVADARQKLQYDLYYIKNQSLTLDLVIVFETVKTVLFGKGR